MIAPDYMGDGVYATDDQRGLIITTGHHLVSQADNVIVLEFDVLAALERYIARMKADRAAQST